MWRGKLGFTDFMVSISEAPQIKLLYQLGEHVPLTVIPLKYFGAQTVLKSCQCLINETEL